jgi:CheY-like chemotaxis protein
VRATPIAHAGNADTDGDVVLAAPPGDYLAIVVTDDGPGFDVETRRHVFEPFFTTKATGHGLGLAAVLGIVRAHGGGIRVRSELGKGASFEVLWPAANARARSNPPAPQPPQRTVLVVDDEDLVRDVVARMIVELGYAAVTAADGTAALAILEQRAIDAVLVDLTMPTMNGADVIAAVRALRPGLPVVLCSGFDRSGKGPVAADGYLPKPFRIEALERTLAKLLPLRSV